MFKKLFGKKKKEEVIEEEVVDSSLDGLEEVETVEEAIESNEESITEPEGIIESDEESINLEDEIIEHNEEAIVEIEEIVELEEELEKISPAAEQAYAAEQAAVQALNESDAAMHTWQTQWESFTHQAAEPARVAEVEAARSQQLEMQQSHLSERQEKLKTERDNNMDPELEKDLAELNIELETKKQKHIVNQCN